VLCMGITFFLLIIIPLHSGGVAVRHVRLVATGSLCVLTLALVCVVVGCIERTTPLALEIITVCFLCVVSSSSLFVVFYYAAKVQGLDLHELAPATHFSDSRLLLLLSCFLAADHVALPVRWCSSLAHEVFSVFLYLFCVTVLGSPDEDGIDTQTNLVLFTSLTTILGVGKRQLELRERLAFQKLVGEKCARFEAEFQLSRLQDQIGKPEAVLENPADDMKSSLPETTITGQVFASANLEGIMNIGRQEQWLIDREELELKFDQILGQGGFGTVIAGSYQGVSVAVKIARDKKERMCESNLLALCNEARVLRKLRHPNIVVFYGLFFEVNRCALVLELIEGTTLKNYVCQEPEVPVEQRVKLIQDTSCALRYLHSRKPRALHGDVKDSNILLLLDTHLPSPKLLDFGLSLQMTQHAQSRGGTVAWMSPELLVDTRRSPDMPSDVFSFGRVMFFVLTGVRSVIARNHSEALRILKSGYLPEADWPRERLDTRHYQRLVCACTRFDPSDRPSMLKVNVLLSGSYVDHEQMTSVDWLYALDVEQDMNILGHGSFESETSEHNLPLDESCDDGFSLVNVANMTSSGTLLHL